MEEQYKDGKEHQGEKVACDEDMITVRKTHFEGICNATDELQRDDMINNDENWNTEDTLNTKKSETAEFEITNSKALGVDGEPKKLLEAGVK